MAVLYHFEVISETMDNLLVIYAGVTASGAVVFRGERRQSTEYNQAWEWAQIMYIMMYIL